MKIILIRLLSVTFLLLGFSSCVGPVGPAYGGGGYGYDAGGYGYGQSTYIVDNDVAYYDNYGHYSSYSRPGYVRYYGINCAHPGHFGEKLPSRWPNRIGMVRPNASRRSPAELDQATELDGGEPQEFSWLFA